MREHGDVEKLLEVPELHDMTRNGKGMNKHLSGLCRQSIGMLEWRGNLHDRVS